MTAHEVKLGVFDCDFIVNSVEIKSEDKYNMIDKVYRLQRLRVIAPILHYNKIIQPFLQLLLQSDMAFVHRIYQSLHDASGFSDRVLA